MWGAMTMKTIQAASVPPVEPAAYDQIPPLDVLGMLRVVWYGKWLIAATVAFAIT